MNLIDLLQALGPSRKTVRITIYAAGVDQKLEIFLDEGALCYARLDDLAGPPAVYEAIGWVEGTWAVEPVSPEDLPEANNDLSNESILMEGCRLMDEKVRTGQLL